MQLLVAVHREQGRVSVVLRPYRRWGMVWVFLAVVVVTVALRSGVRVPEFVGAGLLGIAACATYGAALATAWYLVGREVVTATPASITIEHFIIRRRRTEQYSAGKVMNLRAQAAGRVMRRGRLVRALAALAFEHDGETVRFAVGLAGAEADAVLADLQSGLMTPGGSAARV
ncbi:hypothetical protein [Anaeromyxobacter oryzae]|uniref:DUF304 domain-containing protein n=1 Tax=Anaeromyxobacter oryzae TaxID=2918170 RepID=A0ABM7WQ48_9BACT|nr:hypothetical protein [Anaeromyxobacter oryzae]BDG01586.1 hypothetical protein AMOR_05820 [Anaeromyxobacter oryzae]